MSAKREQLIEAALRLFNTGGFKATGIEQILAEAGVAKMTLYKHFRSKDDLVLAALRRRDEEWRAWFSREVEARSPDPAGRLIAIFDVAEMWFEDPAFNGCYFIRASGEFSDGEDPVHQACVEHGRLVTRYLSGLAEQAGATSPESLARQLLLLFNGAVVDAQTCQRNCAAGLAKRAAEALVAVAIPARA